MTIILICLLINISFGAAILIVEKGDIFPIRKPRIIAKKFLHDHISRKFAKVLDCSTCSSFWISGGVDICLFALSGGTCFLWPLSGFAAAGFTWFIIEYLNAIDNNLK